MCLQYFVNSTFSNLDYFQQYFPLVGIGIKCFVYKNTIAVSPC